MIGASIPRVEDARFLRGEGRYLADLRIAGMLEAVVVRSPYGHARLLGFDATEALASPGVHAIFTAEDLPGALPRIPCRIPSHGNMSGFLQPVLGQGVARYFGEPFAVVIAESRSQAEDAAELIEFDWDPLPALASGADAGKADAPQLHEAGNIASRWGYDLGDVEAAKAEAAAVVEETFTTQRHTAMPLETRGLLASYDAARNLLEVHGPTKVPHTNRAILATMLDLSEGDIRFIEPDVGGSFGARGEFYPEDFLIPWIALRLRRPIRWVEDRLEHFASINHSREMRFTLTACADAEGNITAFDIELLADMGAYIRTHGDVVPSHAAASFPGPYRLRNYRCQAIAALSNKTPTGTLRAPGMFEANFARERAVDRLAEKLGLDPLELRRRNLIRPEELPWSVGTESVKRPVIYDSGDFPDILSRAVANFGWDQPPAAASGALRRGRGIAVVVEPSAFGPFEAARIEIDPRGRVEVISGCSSQGQGHETVLAQVAAEVLRVPMESIRVRHGDTGLLRYGGGSYASRTAVMSGHAVTAAAETVKAKAIAAAARKLEAPEDGLVLEDGRVRLKDAPEVSIGLGEIARMLAPGNPELTPPPREANAVDQDGLTATSHIRAFPSGTSVFAVHLAEVEVDTETGQIAVTRYQVAADIGRAINPLLVKGQLIGGVAQGLGGALLEELVYDSEAQLQTGTFADYMMPSVAEVPRIDTLVIEEARASSNPLGVKGAGEIGTSGVAAVLGNAIANALGGQAGLNVLPLTPERVLAALGEAS